MARTFTLYAAKTGQARLLTDPGNGIRVLKGITGLNAPPFVLLTSDTPLLDGEQLDDVYAATRDIVMPLLITGRTEAEFRERARTLIADVFPLHGECTLEVAQPDGQRRRVRVIYTGGLEGAEAINDAGVRWWKTGIRLTALNPWWMGDPITREWKNTPPVNFLPITPRRVSLSSVIGDTVLNNPGDVETYPVWTLTAPADGVTLTRPDTGEFLGISHTLPANTTLTIVTNPRQVDLRLSTDETYWKYLTNGSSLFQLPAGNAPLSLQVIGGGAGTVLGLSYTPRYATCL